ncbi:MAG: signal peptidase II, partial [Lachnospiraceae bacterium]|nr:signal peptidase II [Lachnospiraceae bacterium]
MNKKTIRLAVDVVLMLLLIALDQTTKYFAVEKLMNQKPFVLWDGVFELHYLENRGAAFGLLQGQKIFFVLISFIILAGSVYVLVQAPYQKRVNKLHITLVFIASGAIGNLIDRLRY